MSTIRNIIEIRRGFQAPTFIVSIDPDVGDYTTMAEAEAHLPLGDQTIWHKDYGEIFAYKDGKRFSEWILTDIHYVSQPEDVQNIIAYYAGAGTHLELKFLGREYDFGTTKIDLTSSNVGYSFVGEGKSSILKYSGSGIFIDTITGLKLRFRDFAVDLSDAGNSAVLMNLSKTHYARLTRLILNGAGKTSSQQGIVLDSGNLGSHYNRISECEVFDFEVGILLKQTTSFQCNANVMRDNTIKGVNRGIGNQYGDGNDITGNTIEDFDTVGIRLDHSLASQIRGGYLESNNTGATGIQITANAYRTFLGVGQIYILSGTDVDDQGIDTLPLYQGYVRITNRSSLPTAEAYYRGRMIRVQGGAGVTDHVYICQKHADDLYYWDLIL